MSSDSFSLLGGLWEFSYLRCVMATLHSVQITRPLFSRISFLAERDIRCYTSIQMFCYDNGESFQSNKSLFLRILLSNLLQVQAEERYGVEDVKNCQWFESVDWNEVFLKKIEPPKVTFRQTEPKENMSECNFSEFYPMDPDEQPCFDDEFSEF